VNEIICLGIGRITECSIAKHQLAFIAAIGKHLKADISFFDPILSFGDKQVLEKLNYKVLSDNKEGKYLAKDPTLYYLPHCPKQITNNLLYTNWNPENIQNVFLICNSFKAIIDTTPERFLRPSAHYILEINPFVTEVEIVNDFKFTGEREFP
jgi:SRR1